MKPRPVIFAALLISFLAVEAAADWVWTPQTRRWINPKYAAKDTPGHQMEWAVDFFEGQDYPRAVKEFIRLVRTYPRSELAPKAQYLAGLSYELMNKPRHAFRAYKQVVEVYPFSVEFKEAVEREFLIAESFFAGKRMELIGPVTLPALSTAIEIYQHVVDHAPYGAFGARAQLRLGECYLKQNRFEEANRAFQRVVDEYPASDLIEDAEFKVAYCARQLSLKASYDQSATEEAMEWFESFIESHPDSDLVPEAKKSLVQLREIKAKGLAEIAQFYEIQGKPKSAVFYYREIVDLYPESSYAATAVSKLQELDAE